jgi:hypothetical protein
MPTADLFRTGRVIAIMKSATGDSGVGSNEGRPDSNDRFAVTWLILTLGTWWRI